MTKKMVYKYSPLNVDDVDVVLDRAADGKTLSTYHCVSLCHHGNHIKHCKENDAVANSLVIGISDEKQLLKNISFKV